jgi:hypothetical protein
VFHFTGGFRSRGVKECKSIIGCPKNPARSPVPTRKGQYQSFAIALTVALPKEKTSTKEYSWPIQNLFGSGKKVRVGIVHLAELSVLYGTAE